MVRFWPLLALLALLPAADAVADEAAARALFERNLQAIRDRDRQAYLDCYLADERLVVGGFGAPTRGYEAFAAGAGDTWPDSFEAFDLQVFGLTDDVVFGRYRYRVRYDQDVQEGISERVFLRTPEGWRIAVSTAFEAPDGVLPAIGDGSEHR